MAENTYRKKENSPKNSSSARVPKVSNSQAKWMLVTGLVFIVSSIFLLISFISYFFSGKEDQSVVDALFTTPLSEAGLEVSNWFGIAGAVASQFFVFRWFGISAFLILPILFHIGYWLLYRKGLFNLTRYTIFTVFAGSWIGTVMGYIAQFIEHETIWGYYCGGIGYELALLLQGLMGWGSLLFFVFTLMIFIVFFYDISSIPAIENVKEQTEKFLSFFQWPFKKKEKVIHTLSDDTEEENAVNSAINKIKNDSQSKEEDEAIEEELKKWTVKTVPDPPRSDQKIRKTLTLDIDNGSLANEEFTVKLPPASNIEERKEETPKEIPFQLPPVIARTRIPSNEAEEIDLEINEVEEDEQSEDFVMENYDPTLDLPRYKYPTPDLLFDYPPKEAKVTKEELEANKDKIVETLINFKIGIASIKATIGPTVTLYEIVPDAGIKISKIKNLEDDIALSLSALGIRIIAPIPGKGTIGIEVPNKNKEMVDIKSVITTEKFLKSDKDLPVVLGKTISNEVFVTDLAKMPHLLIAGATGQGKSVGLNVVLTSLIYKKHPSQLKFVLVDPKKVELTLFNKLERHFLAMLPNSEEAIITDTSKVINTLNSLCIEMDSRYDLLKDAGCRNLKEYNTKFVNRRLNPKKGHKYLPYIVLVIDELADLMITAGKEVETPIARLAQLARAIGIHLIVATQRPSVNVITGIIKANFPARLSFRVTSKIDSRTILDTGGADQLIGQGDMLLSMGSEIIRLQCAFVDTPEVDAICDYIGEQQGYETAYLLPEFEGSEDGDFKEVDLSERDSLFDEAARLIVRHQQGSTSLIQRKMKLGYNRAGRIIDQLEAAGIVGAFEGSKAREVLIQDEHTLEQLLSGLDK